MKRGTHTKPGKPAKPVAYKVAVTLVVAFCLLLLAGQFGVLGLRSLAVQSASMEPNIRQSSVVFTLPVSSPEIGDVITFERQGQPEILITHRVVDVRQEGAKTVYITKGDANEGPDGESLPAENVVGKVWLTIPWLGGVVDAARTDLGFIALIIIPATIIVYNEILNLRQQVSGRRSKGRTLSPELAGERTGQSGVDGGAEAQARL